MAITGATIELSDNITTDNANITLTGAVVLDGGDVVVTSGGGDIEFTSTVDTKERSRSCSCIGTIANTSQVLRRSQVLSVLGTNCFR